MSRHKTIKPEAQLLSKTSKDTKPFELNNLQCECLRAINIWFTYITVVGIVIEMFAFNLIPVGIVPNRFII